MKKNIAIVILSMCCIALLIYIIFYRGHRYTNYEKPSNTKEASTAIGLAQNARTFGNKTVDNNYYIKNQISKIKGIVNIEGWQANKIKDNIFIVEYKYDRPSLSWINDSRSQSSHKGLIFDGRGCFAQ